MSEAVIVIHKEDIDKLIDSSTYKRTDATMDQNSDRSQNAVSSDRNETLDGFLMAHYRDRWDARIRAKLKFALVTPADKPLFFDSTPNLHKDYVYRLRVGDDVTADDIQVIGTLAKEYLVRGVLFDWYNYMNLPAPDTMDSLEELLNDLTSRLRGKSYQRRPMQPFGPAYKYR